MEKSAVIYKSLYGSSKIYAEWIAEELGAELFLSDNITEKQISNFSIIIFCGGIYAGGIACMNKIKKYSKILKEKKLIICAVGASPFSEDIIKILIDRINKEINLKFDLYYFRGNYSYSKMKLSHKTMMKVMDMVLKKQIKNGESVEAWAQELNGNVFSDMEFCDKKFISSLIEKINRND